MVGLKISSEEIKTIIPILGLTDEEQGKVYLSLLSLGMATLGQISLLSGLDYIKTREALHVLEGSNLVKRVPGIVGRYVALEPFLKAFFLAYDPITLVNIRKEASTTFEANIKQISDIFAETTEILQKHSLKLEDDFSQSLSPIKMKFNELTKKYRKTIDFSKNEIQKNVDELKINGQQMMECFEDLNQEIKTLNFVNLDRIPTLFDPYTNQVEQKLKTLSQTTNDELDKYRGEYKTDFKVFYNKIDDEIREFSESIDETLNQFETNRSNEEKAFNEKIEKTHSLLGNLKSNINQKKSNFLEIRQGYQEIDNSVRDLLSGLEEKLKNIEPLLEGSIADIQSRKLFKGKDEFITNLTKINEDRKTILQTLKDQTMILDDIDTLNNILNESEDEIVLATETGIQEVRKILDEEKKLLSHDLEEIKQKISSEFRKKLKEFLNTTSQELKTQMEDGKKVFNEKGTNFSHQLEQMNKDFLNNLSDLVQETAKEFKTDLKNFFEKEPAINVKSSLEDLLNDTTELNGTASKESESVLSKIADLENEFDQYISGLKAFTASFANTQMDEFNITLNKTKDILNSQMVKVEQQLEDEISALTYSIKEMKQKLNKISELSQVVGVSETTDTSFLSSDLVIGETAIIMMLRDLTLRAKASLTILMPRPELQTLVAASKLPTRTRISIIGDFRKVPESTLKKILSSSNVRLKQLDTVDFWGCIRDSEELLVCPEPKQPEKEDLIGVFTTNENLVELFSQELMTYTTRSREIVL